MGSNFSSLLQQAMVRASVDRRQAVLLLGYCNLNKGMRNLDTWLSGCGVPASGDQVNRVAVAFGLTEADIHAAMKQDAETDVQRRKELRRRDPNYRVTVRLIPGFYLTHKLPGSLPLDEALRQAQALAEGKFRFALNTSENLTYWCDETGRIESVNGNEPYMSIKGQPFRLEAKDGVVS